MTSPDQRSSGRRRSRRSSSAASASASAPAASSGSTSPTPLPTATPTPARRPRGGANEPSSRDRSAKAAARRPKGPVVSTSGRLSVHPRGFGFIQRDGGDDVFVPGPLLKGLFDGDLVEAQLHAEDTQARRVRLLERTRTSFIGSVSKDGKKVDVDPGVGTGSFTFSGRARPGDVVRFDLADGGARIVEVVGSGSDPRCAFVRFLDRYQLPADRPADVAKELRRRPRRAAEAVRRDLRGQLVFTIDDDSSQDLDDALSARVEPDGSIRLWVHIADVAEHVRPGSACDRAAASVPTSVYLPQGVRHMLPDEMGAQTLSLLPGVDRDTLCVEIRLDSEGRPRGVDVYEARIRSQRRLNYSVVADVLAGQKVGLPADVVEMLQVLRTAATRLDLWRAARGGLDAMHADQGSITGARDDAAHRLIERLMVATNEAVALWLTERGMPALWRAHDPLTAEQGAEIERVARGFGVVAALGSPVSPRALAVAAAQVPQGQAGSAFWDAVLGVLGRAYYTVERHGHFGLASDGYLHFTSPLRRYPDLLVHRVVKSYLQGDRDTSTHQTALAAAAPVANDVFRRAALAERDATLFAGLSRLAPGQELAAFVVGRARNGLRLRLAESGLSAFLSDDARSGRELKPGHKVRVRVVSVTPLAGKLELRVLNEVAKGD